LFSAPSTKVRTRIRLLINKSPALCFDTKLSKKTKVSQCQTLSLSPLTLLTSKPKTLINDCSSDAHLEVNHHILVILIADKDKSEQQLLVRAWSQEATAPSQVPGLATDTVSTRKIM